MFVLGGERIILIASTYYAGHNKILKAVATTAHCVSDGYRSDMVDQYLFHHTSTFVQTMKLCWYWPDLYHVQIPTADESNAPRGTDALGFNVPR